MFLKSWFYLGLVLCVSSFMGASWSTTSDTANMYPSTYCSPVRDVQILSPNELSIVTQAARAGVDSQILRAVIQHESGFITDAYNPDDPSYGLGQVMPKYWRYTFIDQCGSEATAETLMDAEINICYAAHILAHFQHKYGYVAGIDAYNNGHGASRGYSDTVLELAGD